MSDSPNIVLEYLRRMDRRLDSLQADVADIKTRLTNIERHAALLHEDFAGQSVRLDRLDNRVERIERRLDLSETPEA